MLILLNISYWLKFDVFWKLKDGNLEIKDIKTFGLIIRPIKFKIQNKMYDLRPQIKFDRIQKIRPSDLNSNQ